MFLLVPAYPGCPGQTAVKMVVVVVSSYIVKAVVVLIKNLVTDYSD